MAEMSVSVIDEFFTEDVKNIYFKDGIDPIVSIKATIEDKIFINQGTNQIVLPYDKRLAKLFAKSLTGLWNKG